MRHALFAILTIFVLALGTPVKAQSFEDGVKAYNAGDYSTAYEIFSSFRMRGNAAAYYNIGLMHFYGHGMPQNYEQAETNFWVAAYKGIASAQYNVGVMSYEGLHSPKNYERARDYFLMAAKQGHAEAQYNLGIMYYKGQSVPQDYITAHMWFNLAGVNGGQEATSQRENLAKKMTAEQIATAQRRATSCLKHQYFKCD